MAKQINIELKASGMGAFCFWQTWCMVDIDRFSKFGCYNGTNMTVAAIRQKLYEYIRVADDKKVKAMYTLVAEETSENSEWWQDKKLIAQLDAIDTDMENGVDKGVSWGEAKKEWTKK